MKDKEFEKLFKEEFKKDNSCDLSISDIIPDIDQKQLNEIFFLKYKKQQYKTKMYAVKSVLSIVILFIVIITFTIKVIDYKSKMANFVVLSEEIEDYMIEYCNGLNGIELISYEKLAGKLSVSIYLNRKYSNTSVYETVYFYVIEGKYNDLEISVNNKEIAIDSRKNYGILETCGTDIEFVYIEILYNNHHRKIWINNKNLENLKKFSFFCVFNNSISYILV